MQKCYILTCNVVWWVVFCGRCKCAVKIAMAAPVASREGCEGIFFYELSC